MSFAKIDRNLAQRQLRHSQIESACLPFNVSVTGEEVKNG